MRCDNNATQHRAVDIHRCARAVEGRPGHSIWGNVGSKDVVPAGHSKVSRYRERLVLGDNLRIQPLDCAVLHSKARVRRHKNRIVGRVCTRIRAQHDSCFR